MVRCAKKGGGEMLGITITGKFLACVPRPPKKDGTEYTYPWKTKVMTAENAYDVCTSEKVEKDFGDEVVILVERINSFKDELYLYGYEV